MIKHTRSFLCIILFYCSSCGSARHLYFGEDGSRDFDSSYIAIKKIDRLAYVSFLDYKTTSHEAGEMLSNSTLASLGIFTRYSTERSHQWSGGLIFSSGADSSIIMYSSFIGEVYRGNYGPFSLETLLGEKSQPTTDVSLSVTGIIYYKGDSATFLFRNQDTIPGLLDGYIIYDRSIIAFNAIDRSVTSQNRVVMKPYGYGIFLHGKIVAALNFNSSPKKVYVSKNLSGFYKNAVVAYLAIAIANKNIRSRKSRFLKTFW